MLEQADKYSGNTGLIVGNDQNLNISHIKNL